MRPAAHATAWLKSIADGWNHFWFTPSDPATLGAIRICAGAMLFYTHLVWGLDLDAFFGAHSWVTADAAEQIQGGSWAFSYFWWIESPAALWAVHIGEI